MSKDKVRDIVNELDMVTYRLDTFAEVIRDIIDDIPINEEDDNYPLLCRIFCLNAQKKLDVLTCQLKTESEENIKLVSALEKEVFTHE